MERIKYSEPEMEVITFNSEDVLMASDGDVTETGEGGMEF